MSICIPYADGIWNMYGPPNWGLANLATPAITTINPAMPAPNDAIKDPRWRGSVNQSFGAGIAEDASFRAVWYTTAGKQYIYLSWHIKFDSQPQSDTDRLYIAIAPSAGGGSRPLVIEIRPFTDSADHLDAEPPDAITAGRRRSVATGNVGEEVGTSEALNNLPSWLADDTKVWRSGTAASQGQWAVHMRIPVDPLATDVDGNGGLRLTTSFKMWYEMRVVEVARADMSGTGISGGALRLNIPTGVSLTNFNLSYPDPNTAGQGETYTYGSVAGINGISCPATNGISIQYLDIGTDNAPTSYIDPVNNNIFWAKPRNDNTSAVPQSAINATFRLADWGSTRLDGRWTTIQSGVLNQAIIPAGPLTQADATNDCRFTKANMAATYPRVNTEPHQCMLVELSGAGLLFTISSVVRNMDFVLNSKDVRQATISIEGLKPIGAGPRDVYLAVETVNMPRNANTDVGLFGPIMNADIPPDNTDSLAPPNFEFDRAVAFNQDPQSLAYKVQQARTLIRDRYDAGKYEVPRARLELMTDVLREVGATSDDLDRLFPTYRVHVYYDSGETWKVDGKTYALLGLQPSFGFYAYHEGQLVGYETRLHGAVRLTENVYLLPVPNNGSAKVTTVLQGVSPGEESQIEPDEPIQGWPKTQKKKGCRDQILALFGLK